MNAISLEEESGTRIVLCLLKNLKNTENLRKKILSGKLNCCAINPSLVIDRMQIVVAARRAVLNKTAGKLTTKSLNSELLFNLSPSKNISQSLSKFGIGDSNENVLLVVFEEKGEKKFDAIRQEFEGEECQISQIPIFSDFELVKKTYKITETELQVSTLTDSVITRVAVKEFGSF